MLTYLVNSTNAKLVPYPVWNKKIKEIIRFISGSLFLFQGALFIEFPPLCVLVLEARGGGGGGYIAGWTRCAIYKKVL